MKFKAKVLGALLALGLLGATTAAAIPPAPKGHHNFGLVSCSYWTLDSGRLSSVVRTFGNPNCSVGASFTVAGNTWVPDIPAGSGSNAFEHYLGSVAGFVYPYPYVAQVGPDVTGLTYLGTFDNAYTNYNAVSVWQGPASNGVAQAIVRELEGK